METKKYCEVCHKEIPLDFVNLLCLECYQRNAEEHELKKSQEEEEKKQVAAQVAVDEPVGKAAMSLEVESTSENYKAAQEVLDSLAKEATPFKTLEVKNSMNGITDPNYKENPEAEDKNQVIANFTLFQKTGKFIWHPTRDMYEWIKNYGMDKARGHTQFPKYVWKPKIVDVGCGCGLGSNILSQEADFVWGIDKNKLSVDFAKECFTRIKNNIYYCPQVTFDQIDIVSDTRETMKFDFVVAIEIIEHINDYKTFLKQLIVKFDKRDPRSPTEYFISTPNRNNKGISKEKPKNLYHVREYTSEEFCAVLSEFFNKVELHNSKGEPTGNSTDHTPLIARCSEPKI